MSVWQLLVAGGYTMIPLLACSILALAIFIEKSIVLRTNRVIPEELTAGIRHNPIDINEVLNLCNSYPSPFSMIIKTVLLNRSFQKSANQENTQMEGKIQVNNMERGLVILEVVAAVAPLLGLLGTVLGLVDVFFVISKMGIGQTAAFAGGIAKALITTVVGLIIAIPSLIAYRYFSKRVENMVLAMEREASDLINKLYGV